MRPLTRRSLLALLVAGLALAGILPSPSVAALDRSAKITILQLNDLYDLMPVERGKKGGLARVATLRDRIAKENPNLVLVLAGDFLSPSTMSSAFQGSQMIAGLNAIGLDLATFGNHEFDFGEAVTEQRMQESRFTWVSSNVLDPKTGQPFGPAVRFALRELGGIRVAFIGLTTPETQTLSKGGKRLKFLPPIPAAKEAVAAARRAKADVIVALTHQFMADDKALARAVPEIDLILGGHEHDPLNATVGQTLILKTGSEAVALGRIDLAVRLGGERRIAPKWELIPVTDQIPDAPEMATLIKGYEGRMAAQLGAVAGETQVALDSRNDLVRAAEAPLGNLIADILREAMQADAALVNGGGIRGNSVTPAGRLTRGDVLKLLPFANKIVKLEVSGAQLKEALENGVSQHEKGAGRFPQVSGIRYTFDPKRAVGARVLAATVGSAPLDPQARYTLATFEFLMGGGDGYDVLKQAKVLVAPVNGPMDSDLLLERLKAGPVAPGVDGRVQRVP